MHIHSCLINHTLLQQVDNPPMKEDKQNKQNKQEPKYVCPNKRAANFCCVELTCKNYAIKCVGSNQCDTCKKNHNKCPREIRITQVVERAEKRQQQQAPEQKQFNEEDLIQKLIDQLVKVKKKYKAIDNKRWGLDQVISSFIYEKQIREKRACDVSNLMNSDEIVFPDVRYYCPPQFRKDVSHVQNINAELEIRMLAFHKVYKILAECSCDLKRYQKNKVLDFDFLVKLHRKFKQAIFERLKISHMFAGIEHVPCDEEIANFKDFGMRLLIQTFKIIQDLKNKQNHVQGLKLIDLALDLFNEDRKEYRLEDKDSLGTQNMGEILQKLLEYEGIFSFETGDYKRAWVYYSKLSEDKLTIDILKKLIKMCKSLKEQAQILLFYLLKLEKIEAQNTELLEEIIRCYQKLKERERLYHYYRKINFILDQNVKDWKIDMLLQRIKRYKWLVEYQEKQGSVAAVLATMMEALKNMDKFEDHYQLVKFILELRYRMALIHRFNNHKSQASEFGIRTCEKALIKLKNNSYSMEKIEIDRLIYFINDYFLKFLVLAVQTNPHNPKKSIYLEKAVKICEDFQIKLFEPYYLRAKHTFDIGNQTAKQCQIEAIKIYPTYDCLANLAALLYQGYFISKNLKELKQCVFYIGRSLLLKSDQTNLYYLRALAYQNLGSFKQSNNDFEKILQKLRGDRLIDAERRMAQNYLFIFKQESKNMTSDLKEEILDRAKKLYQSCLQYSQHSSKTKCMLGYARVRKLQQQFNDAIPYLVELQDSDLKIEAYMELGNIKQLQGKKNDERDFKLLEQALEMYKKADRSQQNLQNLMRIYLQLDQPKKADQIEKQIEQKYGKRPRR